MTKSTLKKVKLLNFTSLSYEKHLVINFLLRLCLIGYSVIHDQLAEVPYTDIDYKVVTDGARHVWNNESPFRRHTYRYSPILAILMIPNIILHECFGKVLFCLCDVLSSCLIKNIVYNGLENSYMESFSKKKNESPTNRKTVSQKLNEFRVWSEIASYLMLYNPIGIAISSRGSNDAISNTLILLTYYFIQKSGTSLKYCFFAGIFHGLSIHFRIFPIIFSLTYYLCIANKWNCILRSILLPNRNQFILATTSLITLISITYFMYILYGFQYIRESYLYHFIRIDTRHNFSLYFLMQYLNSNSIPNEIVSALTLLPRVILLVYLSITLGRNRNTLALCIFAQTFIFVTYNTVVTSQYFVWYLILLPLCYPNFRHVTSKFSLINSSIWLLTQGLWLLPAYLLEFKCWNTFNLIGFQSIVFFLANIYVLDKLISNFNHEPFTK